MNVNTLFNSPSREKNLKPKYPLEGIIGVFLKIK
jgi:hypothetical protein